MFVCCGADGGFDGENSFDIGSREPMQFTGAEFHAYENAWSVHFQPPPVSAVLVFAICREPCLHAWQGYRMLQCSQLLSDMHQAHWYNAYVDSLDNNTESFCESVRSAPDSVGQAAGNILHDSAGGSLVRLRPPHTLVIFNQQDVIDEWMLESAEELSVSLRATQIEPHGQLFGVQHFVHTVRLLKTGQRADFLYGRLTFALQNGCTALGLSAPEFASVRSVNVSGRLRCVWDCRADMVREPYNSVPPTVHQLNASREEYMALPVKYACVQMPSVWVGTVLGFTLAVDMSAEDVGYAQALLDAMDNLALAVRAELAAAGIQGIMLFSIKNSDGHTSFADRIAQLQEAQCAAANVQATECKSTSVSNPDYVYRRRLLAVQQAQIEGLFISSSTDLFTGQNLQTLQGTLSAAIVENVNVLAYDTSVTLPDIEDIDFAEVVFFTVPSPKPEITQPTPAPSTHNTGTSLHLAISCLVGFCLLVTVTFVIFYSLDTRETECTELPSNLARG